jgi:hypothetical protein
MPHVNLHLIKGKPAPSVNKVTDLIPKPWLEAWKKKVGTVEAEKISKASREKGNDFHELFDQYWKGQVKQSQLEGPRLRAVTDLAAWATENKIVMQASEPHLESEKHLFHGSPDGVHRKNDRAHMLDYKFKPYYPDYKTILNEAGYSLMWEEVKGEKIDFITILNFSKETGAFLREITIPNEPVYTSDFLLLREAYHVVERSEAWDEKYIRSNFKKKV